MLLISDINKDAQKAIDRLKIKNFDASEKIAQILELDEIRKKSQNELDNSLAEMNKISKEIGVLFKEGKLEEAEQNKAKTAELKQKNKELEAILNDANKVLNELLVTIPNIPHQDVPAGKSAEDNEIVHEEGAIPELSKKALPHWDLAKKYDIIDFELGNKITGAGFPVYKGKGARLQRALINYFLDKAVAAGYAEVQPPYLINEDSGYGTGQLPDKDGQMYGTKDDKFYLIPTAEVPVTNLYRDVILQAEELPVKNVAYSACFRREAGSYGKDVRGLNRLHQFDKVEIVQIQHPEKSYQTLEDMKDYVAGILRELKLPFRIAKLCGGDLSFTSAFTYDMEVYSSAQKRWLEVSSISNFETYQSNRLKLRFREGKGKTQLAHTLNGSALALPRILAALLENNQTDDGILIPEVLKAYAGFDKIS